MSNTQTDTHQKGKETHTNDGRHGRHIEKILHNLISPLNGYLLLKKINTFIGSKQPVCRTECP